MYIYVYVMSKQFWGWISDIDYIYSRPDYNVRLDLVIALERAHMHVRACMCVAHMYVI